MKEILVNDSRSRSIVDAAKIHFRLAGRRKIIRRVNVRWQQAIIPTGRREKTDLFRGRVAGEHLGAIVSASLGGKTELSAEDVVALIVAVAPDAPFRVIRIARVLWEGITVIPAGRV